MSAGLALPVLLALAHACAPQVAPETLLSVAKAESGLDPLTIGVNGRPHRALHPASLDAAVQSARALLSQGANLDLGLTQINVRNLAALRLTVADAFDPCRNLWGGAHVLAQSYTAQPAGTMTAQNALDVALSRYNTGDPSRGLRNGYVASVRRAAAMVVPALAPLSLEHVATAPTPADPVPTSSSDAVAVRRSVDVFARPAAALVAWDAPVHVPSSTSLTPSGDPL